MACARCKRPLSGEPVVVDGKGYGPRCAALVGDLLVQPQRRAITTPTRRRARNERQLELQA
jgi:hypothetical protein